MLAYCYSLGFFEEPQYGKIRLMLSMIIKENNHDIDNVFDWSVARQKDLAQLKLEKFMSKIECNTQ